jgi:hypothetical protein
LGSTYENCDDSVYRLLETLVSEHRDDLARCDVRIRLLFAHGDDGHPAIRHRGHPALGLCKVNNLRDRTEGKADATIVLDGDRWGSLSTRAQRALVHHELHHLVATDDRDPLGRPVLRMREHDWEFGGFDEILALYCGDSSEWKFIDLVSEKRREQVLPFAEAPRDEPDPGPSGYPAAPGTPIVRGPESRRRRAAAPESA